MTTTAAAAATVQRPDHNPADTDPDDRRRKTSGVLLIAAAFAVIGGFLVNPVVETPADILNAATAHAGATRMSILLGTLGIVLLIPGLAGLSRALRLRTPRLGAAGVAITLAGFVCLLVRFGVSAVFLELTKVNVGSGPSLALIDRMENHSLIVSLTFSVFLLGHLLGPILLGVGLWRSRFVPRWAAALLPLGAVGHFLSHAVNSHPLDVAAFLALGVGLAAAGVAMVHTSTSADHLIG